jgi:glycosyltransferase involved in cell wall biosynthesis
MTIDIIIPVWNIAGRGLERVGLMLESIERQTKQANKVILVDGSPKGEDTQKLFDVCKAVPVNLDFIHRPQSEFNKPRLLNHGAKASTAQILVGTDCDYIFSPDLLYSAARRWKAGRMILKTVEAAPKDFVNAKRVRSWDFPPALPAFPFGRWACGAFQFHAREWWQYCGGWDERMNGPGGMDHDYRDRFDRQPGQHLFWMESGRIIHQWHAANKLRSSDWQKKYKRNIDIANNDKTIIRNQ